MNLPCFVWVYGVFLYQFCKLNHRIFFYQATGEDYSVEPAESRRPFRALLDIGLIRTTTGNSVFGALKVNNNSAMLIGVILF